MVDSDDEYDGRRRDNTKFVRERNDYSSSNRSNFSSWQSSDNNWSSRPSSNYSQRTHDPYAVKRDRYGNPSSYGSSNYESQPKRSRLNLNHWSNDGPSQQSQHQSNSYESNYDNSYNNSSNSNELLLTQPPYMSFKQFMKGLDDSVDHLEAAKKYNDYKLDFKRKQITEFFNAHKEEEWFRIKFHPIESVKRKKELRSYVKHRAQAFMDLYNQGIIASTTVDIEKSDEITNVLDSIVIKLEGGTDHDLKCLETVVSKDVQTSEMNLKDITTATRNSISVDADCDIDSNAETAVKRERHVSQSDDPNENAENGVHQASSSIDDEMRIETGQEETSVKSPTVDITPKTESREINSQEADMSPQDRQMICDDKSEQPIDLHREDGEADESMSETAFNNKNLDDNTKADKKMEINNNVVGSNELVQSEDMNAPRPLHKTLSIFLRYMPANVTKAEVVKMFKAYDGYLRVAIADPTFDKRFQRRGWVTFDRNVDIRKIHMSLSNAKIRDCEFGAIINRDLSRRIRSVNGIASHRNCVLADLKHTALIILNLDEERGVWNNEPETMSDHATMNETKKSESSTTADELLNTCSTNEKSEESEQTTTTTVSDDGQMTIEVKDEDQKEQKIESKSTLIEAEEQPADYIVEGLTDEITVFGQQTRNPLLIDVEQCLKEKSLGETESINDETGEINEVESPNELEPKPLERDEDLIKVLDKLVFYLRVVHSLDFYNHIDYPNEDEMPNRIGILHARGMVPTANITLKEVNDYIRQFENRITPYLERSVVLSDEEVEKLGKRRLEEETEKFINEHTKELKVEKWQCTVGNCAKKFKGASFVRKHIETKHQDELEKVAQEVEFFNIYLADSRRPQLTEHPINRPGYKPSGQQHTDAHYLSSVDHHSSNSSQSNYASNVHSRVNFGQGNRYQNSSSGGWNNSNNYNRYNHGGYSNGGNRSNRKRFYRDLDAPLD